MYTLGLCYQNEAISYAQTRWNGKWAQNNHITFLGVFHFRWFSIIVTASVRLSFRTKAFSFTFSSIRKIGINLLVHSHGGWEWWFYYSSYIYAWMAELIISEEIIRYERPNRTTEWNKSETTTTTTTTSRPTIWFHTYIRSTYDVLSTWYGVVVFLFTAHTYNIHNKGKYIHHSLWLRMCAPMHVAWLFACIAMLVFFLWCMRDGTKSKWIFYAITRLQVAPHTHTSIHRFQTTRQKPVESWHRQEIKHSARGDVAAVAATRIRRKQQQQQQNVNLCVYIQFVCAYMIRYLWYKMCAFVIFLAFFFLVVSFCIEQKK